MSRAGERMFGTLAQYFLNRLAARADAEAQTEEMGKRLELQQAADDREEEKWRRREAAKGEERQVVERMNGGVPIKMDVGRSFNAETGKYEERVYGAMPVAPQGGADWRLGAGGVAYRTTPQGGIEYDFQATDRVGSKGGKGGSTKAPKRSWVLDKEGNEVLRTEDEIAAGGYSRAPTDAKGREAASKRQAGAEWRRKAGETAGAVAGAAMAPVRAIATGARALGEAMTGGGQKAELAPEDANVLNMAKSTLAQNPMARAEIERRLKAMGKGNLVPLL